MALGALCVGTGLATPAQAQAGTTSTTDPVTIMPPIVQGEPPFGFVQFPTPPGAVLTVEPTSVTAGSTVTIGGNLCQSGAVAVIGNVPEGPFVTGRVNVIETRPNWSVEVTIPSTWPPGTYQVRAGCTIVTGADVGFLYEPTTLQVTAPSSPPTTAPLRSPQRPAPVPVRPAFTG